MEERQKGRAPRRAMKALGVAAIVLGALALWRSGLIGRMDTKDEIRALIEQAGPFAGVTYFVIQVLAVIIAPIPSNVTMMAGAVALGFWPALLLGVGAIWLGSMFMFLAARRLGQKAVHRWVDHGVMEKYLPVIKEKQDMFLFLTLLFPFFPDDMLCMIAGLTTIPTARFAVLMLVARPWGLAFAALLGSGIIALPVWGWAALLAVLGVIFYLAMKYSAEIENRLFDWIAHIGKGKNT